MTRGDMTMWTSFDVCERLLGRSIFQPEGPSTSVSQNAYERRTDVGPIVQVGGGRSRAWHSQPPPLFS